MKIVPAYFRYSAAAGMRQVKPAFYGGFQGHELPHNLEPESKYTRNKRRSDRAAVMLAAGLALATNQIQEHHLKTEFNMVVSEQSSFDTRKAALEYAKRKVTNALKEPLSYEYCVIIDNNNNIVGEFKGDSTNVKSFYRITDVAKGFFTGYNVTTVHGHPDNAEDITTPISFPDFRNLVTSSIEKESIVFNKQGEYSVLKKTDSFVPLGEGTIEALHYIYQDRMINLFNEKNPEKFLQYKLKEQRSRTQSEKKHINDAYSAEVSQFSQTMEGIKAIDDFWRRYAPVVGLEYKTNYSYLKNVKNFKDNS